MNWHRERRYDIAAVLFLFVLVAVSTWRIGLAGRVLAEGDVFTYFYPYWAEATRALRSGRLPMWNPYLFMGVPLVANSQVGFFYPLNWPLWLLFPARRSVHLTIVLHLGLAAANAYVWGRKTLKLDCWAAWTVGAVFSLGGYLGAQMEHVNQLQGLAWLPLMLLLVDRVVAEKGVNRKAGDAGPRRTFDGRGFMSKLRASCALAVVVGLVLLAGHTQTAFVSLFGAALYGLLSAPRMNDRTGGPRTLLQGGALIAGASVLAAVLAAVQLLPTWQLSELSVRAHGLPLSERLSFSLSPLCLGRALLPPFAGGVAPDHLEQVAYVGVAGLALGAIGMMVGKPSRRGGLLRGLVLHRRVCVLVVLGLFFALGLYNPFYVLLARYVPGFAHFRVPARWLALYAIGFAGLAGRGMQSLRDAREVDAVRTLIVGGALVLLIGGAMAGAWLSAEGSQVGATSIVWLSLVIAAIAMLTLASTRPRAATAGLTVLLLGELLVARGALPQGRATASQAFASLRPAVAHLLAVERGEGGPTDRFLSMSDTTFDPGDLPLIHTIYGPQLSADQLYEYVVATKKKEILSPNLPLAFGVSAVDGYDGGVLPLERYVTLQQAFLSEEEVSIDGRLREKLSAIPEGEWLSLFNVRYVITDKQWDAWIDDVFYDLQFGARLSQGEEVDVAEVPPFEATALGIVSHVEQAAAVSDGDVVGVVRVGLADGQMESFPVRAGEEMLREAIWDVDRQAAATRLRWSRPARVTSVVFEATLPVGQWVVRGVTLIDERMGSFQSLVLSGKGRFRQVHSGDVKIYENLDVLPRAFIVSEAEMAADDAAAVQLMQDAAFDPTSQAVLVGSDHACDGSSTTGESVAQPGGEAAVTVYEPERVVVEAELEEAGYLVVTDAYYPGWQVTVDNEPASICRANLLFRAVPLRPGTHRVVFSFQPPIQRAGILISFGGLAALLLVWNGRRIAESVTQCYNG